MQIYKRYLYQEMIGPFLFGFFAFLSTLLGPQMLRMAMKVQNGIPLGIAVQIILLSIPEIILLTLPMSMLLSTMLSIGRLSGHSEIIAMRAGGISVIELARPYLYAGLFVSLLGIFLQENVIHASEKRISELEQSLVSQKQGFKETDFTSIMDYDEQGNVRNIIYAKQVNGRVFSQATVVNKEDGQLVSIVEAEKIYYDENRGWFAENGTIYFYSNDPSHYTYKLRFTSGAGATQLKIQHKPEELIPNQIESKSYTYRQLRKILIGAGKFPKARQLWVELHNKISLPFAALMFALIGVPLGTNSNRKSTSAGFGYCVVIIAIYYLLMLLTNLLGAIFIPPVIAAWFPNIALGGYGMYRILKANY